MKKEKTIRSYKRKTKSGKVVTVRQHTAKYDAADELKKAMKKQGSGEELESRKLTDDELRQVESIVSENSELDPEYLSAFYPELSPRMIKEVMKAYQKKSPVPKAKGVAKASKASTADSGCPFSAEDFKAWYHWDMVSDPKNEAALRVRKELIKKLGPSAYKKYEDQMTDSYTSRGHTKAYNNLPELIAARKEAYNANLQAKTAKAQKAVAEMAGATEAAAKHDERAKAESAKLKAAKGKIDGVLTASKRAEEKESLRKGTIVYPDDPDRQIRKFRGMYLDNDNNIYDRVDGVFKATGGQFIGVATDLSRALGNALLPKTSNFTTRGGRGKHLTKQTLKEHYKEVKLGGKSYYLWKDSDGSFRGSYENPTSRITDGNSIARFTRDQGFKSFKDVEDYLKKYSK